MRGYSVTQRFLFPNPTVAQSHLFTKHEEKTVLQIMNLAAYENEGNECDGISAQQKQGFAALNTGRKKGKYNVSQFVLERIQFFIFNLSWPHCSCNWKRGDVTKTRNEEQARGEGKILIKKREQKRELEI